MRNLRPPTFYQQVRGRIVIIGLLLIILTVSFIALSKRSTQLQQSIYDYDTCSQAPGSRILELYPSICVSSDGRYFGQVIPEETP